jgi:hypothetical protein
MMAQTAANGSNMYEIHPSMQYAYNNNNNGYAMPDTCAGMQYGGMQYAGVQEYPMQAYGMQNMPQTAAYMMPY